MALYMLAEAFIMPSETDIAREIGHDIDPDAIFRARAALRALIGLHLNAGLLIDVQHLDDTAADGIGLYRTEIPFMVRSEFPDVDAQAWLYGRVLDVADGRPVTFRTLDVGGDKVLPYVGAFGDDNPAMGWRAIRIGLDRPAMLRRQLRALIQAANGRPLSVMFPMIAEVAELLRARALLDLELERARRRGQARQEGFGDPGWRRAPRSPARHHPTPHRRRIARRQCSRSSSSQTPAPPPGGRRSRSSPARSLAWRWRRLSRSPSCSRRTGWAHAASCSRPSWSRW